MIQLESVHKRYGKTSALAGVDLAVGEGSVTVLVGESGSGKSTLLRLLTGLEFADDGRVRLRGKNLDADSDWSAIRHRTGYVIQEGGLFPHLSCGDNAGLAARALGWSEQRRRERQLELAEMTRLDAELLDRLPMELSGGQRQRVALIRALMLDPDLLLLDEPLGALDPVIRSELQEELKALIHRLGKTAIIVTHDLPEAAFFSDDLVLMHEGRIVQRGTIDSLRDHPGSDYAERFVSAVRSLP